MMKKVFDFKHDDNFMAFLPKGDKDASTLNDLCGPVGDRWVPPQLIVDPASRKLPRGEFIHALPLIVTEKARKILGPYIDKHVEFLPVLHGSETCFVVNVTRVLDCINHEKTNWEGEEEAFFENPYFDSKKLGDLPIFTTPENSAIVYLRESFVDVCKQNQLNGIIFIEVWHIGKK